MTLPTIKVLLLAAGLGTRLGDLTSKTPKPRIPLGEGKIIDVALAHLKRSGLDDVVVNTHYLGEQIQAYLGDGSHFGLNIEYSEEDPILGTGGAIKRVLERYPCENLLIYNADAVFGRDLPLQRFAKSFLKSDATARFMLREDPQAANIGPVTTYHSSEITNLRVSHILGEPKECTLPRDAATAQCIFIGIHALSTKQVSPYLNNFDQVFSSTKELYPAMLAKGEIIEAELYQGYWCDAGTPQRLEEVRTKLASGAVLPLTKL